MKHSVPHAGDVARTRRSLAEVTLDNLLESAEDVVSHLRRAIRELPTTRALDRLLVRGGEGRLRVAATKPVVLVLGFGYVQRERKRERRERIA